MSDMNEFFYGKDYADREDKFDKLIAELDGKYPNVLPEGRTFGEFFVSTFNINSSGKKTFVIHDEENLVPEHIRQEMTDIFRACWTPS